MPELYPSHRSLLPRRAAAGFAQHALLARARAPLRLRRGDGQFLQVPGEGGRSCLVMGILNVTPDSFSDGGKYYEPALARERAESLLREGADLLDIGAESTRPGARLLGPEEEWERLRDVVEPLGRAGLPAVLSIDTRHASVARRAADAGFALLNLTFPQQLGADLEAPAGSPDAALDDAARRALLRAFDGIALMHARGTPATMRGLGGYGGQLLPTVIAELRATATALVGDDAELRARLLYDPGLGFAKDAEESLALLGQLAALGRALDGPLLVGASRKSMLGAVTGQGVHERLIPSVAAAVLAATQGAAIVRVHDVAATCAALQVVAATERAAAAFATGPGKEPQ